MDLIAYIKHNTQWLFSGAGIYFITAIVSILLLVFGFRKIKFWIKFEGHVTNKK